MEDFFSLEWFKSRMEKAADEKINKLTEEKINILMDQVGTEPPYKTIKLVNEILTVVFRDGSIATKPGATEEHFTKIRKATSKDMVLSILYDQAIANEKAEAKKEEERVDNVIKGFKQLAKLKDFEVKDSTVTLRGTNRTIPPLLVEKFTEIVGDYTKMVDLRPDKLEEMLAGDEEYQSLKNFFMWCCLNPRAEVAGQLYQFLTENSFRITKQGFFVALRNVVTLKGHGDNTLVQFVSNAFNKVKAVWKKNPDNYRVIKFKDGHHALESVTDTNPKGEIVGNLTTLYKDLPNMEENRFTDAHTGTFDIRVGRPVNMPMEKCSWSTADCAHAGLHFTADQIHYVGCGDTSVLVLINPMKVVGIGSHKGRCYEYLPIMTVPRKEATKILHDINFDTLELDEPYALRELENLAEKVKQGFTAESRKYDFNLPSMTSKEMAHIIANLSEMKNIISKRVNKIE